MATIFLSLEHVRDVCFTLAQELLTFDEPIPSFETRFPERLEAILEIPKEDRLYPSLTGQASVLFYSLYPRLSC